MEEKIDYLMEHIGKIEKKIDILLGDASFSSIGTGGESPISAAAEPEKASGRLACPKCGAVGKNVQTENDKDKIINYIGGIPQYGKKFYCKKCMQKWK